MRRSTVFALMMIVPMLVLSPATTADESAHVSRAKCRRFAAQGDWAFYYWRVNKRRNISCARATRVAKAAFGRGAPRGWRCSGGRTNRHLWCNARRRESQ